MQRCRPRLRYVADGLVLQLQPESYPSASVCRLLCEADVTPARTANPYHKTRNPQVHFLAPLHSAGLGAQTWTEVIINNMDYIVDGLVLQLQQPERYPTAAPLFAALLRNADITPTLLPALYEPAACAIQRLSILSRAARPQDTASFLAAVLPIVRAAGKEGALLDAESRDLAERVARTIAHQQAALSAEILAAAPVERTAAGGSAVVDSPVNQSAISPGECGAGAASGRGTEAGTQDRSRSWATSPGHHEGDSAGDTAGPAKDYFEAYHGGKEGFAFGGMAERRERANQIVLSGEDRERLDARLARVAAASELASGAAQVAAPLLLSPDLFVAVAARDLVGVRCPE